MRVDRFISECWKILSRSQLKARSANIFVNEREVKPSRIVNCGDIVELAWSEAPNPELVAEDIPLDILFENDRVLVVNKPQGMVSHPANGNWSGTLVNAVLGYLGSRQAAAFGTPAQDQGRAFRPGIVHRLDKDTSGVIIVAKDPEAQEFLSAQFRDRETKKQYLAIVRGKPEPAEGSIDTLLARDPGERKRFAVSQEKGKRSITHYKILACGKGYSLMSLRPRTGRTHQLRVHMRYKGCPILGDPIYGRPDPHFPGATLMLHAYRLKIVLPGEVDPREFCAPVPLRFMQIISKLGFNKD